MRTYTKPLVVLFVAAIALPALAQDQAGQIGAVDAAQKATWAHREQSPVLARVFEKESDVNIAVKALKDAETAEDSEDAETKLLDALGNEYDQRLDEYAAYLDSLEKQLKDMRKKLDKRREAKTEMVRLRLQVIKAESNDLGWPGEGSSKTRRRHNIFERAADPFGRAKLVFPSGTR